MRQHILAQVEAADGIITVYDTQELYGEKGRFRVLQFADEAVQGALDLDRPDRMILEYPRALIHLMAWNRPQFERAFMIGFGIGTIARHWREREVVTAEASREVAELGRRYFGCEQQLIEIGDGRQLLAKQPDGRFEYIIVDAFTSQGTPSHLTSPSFFELAARKLDEGGAVLLNLMGRRRHDLSISTIYRALAAHFAYTQAFILPADKGHDLHNIILVGGQAPIRCQTRQMAGFIPHHPAPVHGSP